MPPLFAKAKEGYKKKAVKAAIERIFWEKVIWAALLQPLKDSSWTGRCQKTPPERPASGVVNLGVKKEAGFKRVPFDFKG